MLIGGGIGITPMLSVLLWTLENQPKEHSQLGTDYHHQGHIDTNLLKQTLPHGRHQFYVCGPAPMMETLIPELINWGVARNDIYFEAFGPASVALPANSMSDDNADISIASATPFSIQFEQSGRTIAWTNTEQNLLDFAERNGIQVSSGCRAGSCGSCETRLSKGSVRYATPPEAEIAAGHCLICVGTPETNLVLALRIYSNQNC